MGHTRLGSIPKSRKWRELIELIGSNIADEGNNTISSDVQRISAKTLEATQIGLDKAIDDLGLQYTFYLLSQLVLSARKEDWQENLIPFGVHLSPDSGIFDLSVEVQSAVDDFLTRSGRSTDISEIAQQAAGEALAALAGPSSVTLFGSGREELRIAIRGLSTKKGFSDLGQAFFSGFLRRFMNFYVSRITASDAGSRRIPNIGEITEFNDALKLHCKQSAWIVHDYCGEWYSKTEFQDGIDLSNTSRFIAVAVKKLQSELMRQGAQI